MYIAVEEKGLGNINKEGLLKNKLPKGDLGGVITKLFRVISLPTRRESILLLLSSYKPYSTSFYSLE
jgi:hypothetical protein